MLAGEHHLEQRCVGGRERHVRVRTALQGRLELRIAAGRGRAEVGAEPGKALDRERVEQRLAIRKVPPGRRVRDADGARQLTQRQLVDPAVSQRDHRLLEQRLAQVPVVVGAALLHRWAEA